MRAKETILGAAGALLLTGSPAVAFFSGGFFDGPRLVLGVVAWLLALTAALTAERALPRSRPGRAALVGLALLTALTAASIAWAPLSSAAVDDTQRLLAYLGAFVAAVALLQPARSARWAEPGLAAGAFVVIAYGLSERLLPGVVELHRSLSASGRLDQPLTYWNAMGGLAAIGLVLCARLAGDPDRPPWVRAAAGFAGPALGLGLFLTLSRGAIAACAAGLVILLLVAPGRPQLRAVLVQAAAAALLAGLALLLPAVRTLEGGAATRRTDGAIVLAALVAAGALAAYLATRVERAPEDTPRAPLDPRLRRLAGRAALAACVAGALVATVAVHERRTLPDPGSGPARLRSVESNRYAYWEVAARTFARHPAAGVGSGGFRVEWLRERERKEPAEDAHSLYLETASELGLPGLIALALLVGGVVVSGRRGLARRPGLVAGPVAAVSVWAVHAGLDWDWEMPAVTLPAVVLAGAIVVAGDD